MAFRPVALSISTKIIITRTNGGIKIISSGLKNLNLSADPFTKQQKGLFLFHN